MSSKEKYPLISTSKLPFFPNPELRFCAIGFANDITISQYHKAK